MAITVISSFLLFQIPVNIPWWETGLLPGRSSNSEVLVSTPWNSRWNKTSKDLSLSALEQTHRHQHHVHVYVHIHHHYHSVYLPFRVPIYIYIYTHLHPCLLCIIYQNRHHHEFSQICEILGLVLGTYAHENSWCKFAFLILFRHVTSFLETIACKGILAYDYVWVLLPQKLLAWHVCWNWGGGWWNNIVQSKFNFTNSLTSLCHFPSRYTWL